MKIPDECIGQKVHATLRHVLQGPQGIGFMRLLGKDGSLPVLVSQDETTAVFRFSAQNLYGEAGTYAADKETLQAVGIASNVQAVTDPATVRKIGNGSVQLT